MARRDWPELTEALYNEVLRHWLDKPSVSHVVLQTQYPRALVKQLVTEGIPEQGMAPLPSPEKKSRKSTKKSKPSAALPPPPDRDMAAASVIAQQSVKQQVAEMKERLSELDSASEQLGIEADVREARQQAEGALAELEQAERRVDVEARRLANVEERAIVMDNVQRSATEAAIARQALQNCTNLGAILGHLTDKILEGIETGDVEVPEQLDHKVLASLTASVDKMTSAMERAIKIEKGRAGEPEKNLGVKIGILLDGCSEEELDQIIESGGALPPRVRALVVEG